MNDTFTINFFKSRKDVEYSWEQPNIPWMEIKRPSGEVEYCKLLCDFGKKRVYVKAIERNGDFHYHSLDTYLAIVFKLNPIDIVGRYTDIIWDLIDDLKRNLHNRQVQTIKFEIARNQFGFSKIGKPKHWVSCK